VPFPDPKKIQQEVSPKLVLTPEVIEGARSVVRRDIRQARKDKKDHFILWYKYFKDDTPLINMMFSELRADGYYVDDASGWAKGRTVYFQKPEHVVSSEAFAKIRQDDRERHAVKVEAAKKQNDAQINGCFTNIGIGVVVLFLLAGLINLLSK